MNDIKDTLHVEIVHTSPTDGLYDIRDVEPFNAWSFQ